MLLSVLIALLPIAVVAWLLVVRGMSADMAGLWGLACTALIAFLWFGTAPSVIAVSAAAGVVGSLPVALVFVSSIFQITLMQQCGALDRIVALMKGITPGQRALQMLLLNMGFGILLTSLGALPLSVLPPILVALGYSVIAAIILPAIGYTSMCIYALLGAPAVVFSSLVGLSLDEANMLFVRFTPFVTLVVGLAMLFAAADPGKRLAMFKEGLAPLLVATVSGGLACWLLTFTGLVTITGVLAGLVMVLALLGYAKLRGKPLYDASLLNDRDKIACARFSLGAACSPWILLIAISLLINTPALPFFKMVFVEYAMPVELIPGSPERLRMFWQAYFWVLVCTLLTLPFLKVTGQHLKATVRIFTQRAWRVFVSASVFFALAYVMQQSGKNADWQLVSPDQNMIRLMATASGQLFGSLYAAAVPFLGLLGGFVSGSQTSAIAMFTQLHNLTAQQVPALNGTGAFLATISAIGAGIAGAISPAKLQTCAATIDRLDMSNQAFRQGGILALFCTLCMAVLAQLLV